MEALYELVEISTNEVAVFYLLHLSISLKPESLPSRISREGGRLQMSGIRTEDMLVIVTEINRS